MQRNAAQNLTIDPAAQIEAIAKDAGVSVAEACKLAGVSYSTVFRWRQKMPASFENFNNICAAIRELASEAR